MKAVRRIDDYKHQAIMDAAIRLFLRHGYAATLMDEVAREANVTKQTVYAHYQSKDTLFCAMVDELCRKHAPSAESGKDYGTAEAMLYHIGMGYLTMLTSKEGLAATRLVVAEAQRHPGLAERYYESSSRRMLALMSELLAKENRRGRLMVKNTQSAASYFFALLKGNYYLRILLNIRPHPSSDEKEAHVREAVEIFLRVYGGNAPMHTKGAL